MNNEEKDLVYKDAIKKSLAEKLSKQDLFDSGELFEKFYQNVADVYRHELNAEEFADHIIWLNSMIFRGLF